MARVVLRAEYLNRLPLAIIAATSRRHCSGDFWHRVNGRRTDRFDPQTLARDWAPKRPAAREQRPGRRSSARRSSAALNRSRGSLGARARLRFSRRWRCGDAATRGVAELRPRTRRRLSTDHFNPRVRRSRRGSRYGDIEVRARCSTRRHPRCWARPLPALHPQPIRHATR